MANVFPESDLVRKTFIIRQMDFPAEVSLTKRSLVRYFALSFGLISQKESRAKILDVLDALFYFQVSRNEFPKVKVLLAYLTSQKKGVDEKALRYHLKRMLDLGLLEWRGMRIGFVVPLDSQAGGISAGFESKVISEIQKSLSLSAACLGSISKIYR